MSTTVTDATEHAWHTMPAAEVLEVLQADRARGLTAAEVASRAATYGSNRFAAGKVEPRWRAFLRQYADPMQVACCWWAAW